MMLIYRYGLTRDEIEYSLPLIDTTKTLINEICPAFLSNVECRAGKYRRFDGLCTNLDNPSWGSSLSPFTRYNKYKLINCYVNKLQLV